MSKIESLSDVPGIAPLNANNDRIEAAFEKTLSRDGSGPNFMQANLDMNNYRIVNLPNAVSNSEPVTLAQAGSLAGVENPLTQETIGQYLYPETAAETTAGATIVNPHYPPGNVLRYGAAADGATDDTAAIQTAIDVADAAGGGEVFLPTGSYKITDTIDMRNCDRVYMRSDAYARLVQYTANTPIIYFGSNTTGLSTQKGGIENIAFTYSTAQTVAQTSAVGLMLWNSAVCQFRNLWFNNCHSPIQQATDSGTAVSNAVFECVFDQIYIYGFTGTGIKLKPVNTGSTPNNWSKVYINGGGNDVLNGLWLEGQADHFDSLNIENMTATDRALVSISGSGSGVTIDNLYIEKAVADSSCRGLLYVGVNSVNIGMMSVHSTEFDNAVVPTTKIISFFDGNIVIGTLKLTDNTLTGGATIQMLSSFNSTGNPAKRVIISTIQDLDSNISSYGDSTPPYVLRGSYDMRGQAGSFTGSLTGCTTVPTGTIEYTINGDAVTLEIPAISGTSNTTAATVTGAPTAIRPAAAQTVVGITTDNGTTDFGKLVIGTDGVITLHVGVSATFTGSGTKGIAASTVSYRLT